VVAGKTIDLRVKEAEVLHFLATHSEGYVSRDTIMQCVWNTPPRGPRDNRLEVIICGIRRKIELDFRSPRYLKSKKGVGYKLHGTPTEAAAANTDGPAALRGRPKGYRPSVAAAL